MGQSPTTHAAGRGVSYSCGPPSKSSQAALMKQLQEDQSLGKVYGPFSGWYAVDYDEAAWSRSPSEFDGARGCGICNAHCYWSNMSYADDRPGGNPHDGVIRNTTTANKKIKLYRQKPPRILTPQQRPEVYDDGEGRVMHDDRDGSVSNDADSIWRAIKEEERNDAAIYERRRLALQRMSDSSQNLRDDGIVDEVSDNGDDHHTVVNRWVCTIYNSDAKNVTTVQPSSWPSTRRACLLPFDVLMNSQLAINENPWVYLSSGVVAVLLMATIPFVACGLRCRYERRSSIEENEKRLVCYRSDHSLCFFIFWLCKRMATRRHEAEGEVLFDSVKYYPEVDSNGSRASDDEDHDPHRNDYQLQQSDATELPSGKGSVRRRQQKKEKDGRPSQSTQLLAEYRGSDADGYGHLALARDPVAERQQQQQHRNSDPEPYEKLKKCCSRATLRRCCLFLWLLATLAAVVYIPVSIASFIEAQDLTAISLQWQWLTPTCSVGQGRPAQCPEGLLPIDRSDDPRLWNQSGEVKSSTELSPQDEADSTFTLVVASDVQYDWYDGEYYDLSVTHPKPCKDESVCASGKGTRMLAEKVASEQAAAIRQLASQAPVNYGDGWTWTKPDTMVVNGDLTAYFHPWQRDNFVRYTTDPSMPPEIKWVYPSLGNHDYDHAGPNSQFGTDEWGATGQAGRRCNEHHAVEFQRCAVSAEKGSKASKKRPLAERFHRDLPTRYHPGSLSYSWDRGRYHFVTLNYYPEYENAAIGVESSLQWLREDLTKSHSRGAISVLFIHSAGPLTFLFDEIVSGKGVVAIFAGHLHRCVGHRCAWPVSVARGDFKHLEEKVYNESLPSDAENGGNGTFVFDNCTFNASDNASFNCSNAERRRSKLYGPQATLASFLPGLLKDGSIFPCNNPAESTRLSAEMASIELPLVLDERKWRETVTHYQNRTALYKQFNQTEENSSSNHNSTFAKLNASNPLLDSSMCLIDMLSMADTYRKENVTAAETEKYRTPVDLCGYVGLQPFRRVDSYTGTGDGSSVRNRDAKKPTIPIYWSGSLSFQTFLQVGFNATHMKVEVMSSVDGKARRYIDTPMYRDPPQSTNSDGTVVETFMSSDELWGTGLGSVSSTEQQENSDPPVDWSTLVATATSSADDDHLPKQTSNKTPYHCDGLLQPAHIPGGFDPYDPPRINRSKQESTSFSSSSSQSADELLSAAKIDERDQQGASGSSSTGSSHPNKRTKKKKRRTLPMYPWSHRDDFSPPVRNVLAPQYELGPWDPPPSPSSTSTSPSLSSNKINGGVDKQNRRRGETASREEKHSGNVNVSTDVILYCPGGLCGNSGFRFRCSSWGGCGTW